MIVSTYNLKFDTLSSFLHCCYIFVWKNDVLKEDWQLSSYCYDFNAITCHILRGMDTLSGDITLSLLFCLP